MGIRKGDRVALLLPNLPESTIIIYALNKIGAISDNIDPTSKEDRMKYFLEKEKVNEALKDLTSTQFRRIDLHIVNEITIRDVAKLEKVQKSQIQKSLELGLKKIKKFFADFATFPAAKLYL